MKIFILFIATLLAGLGIFILSQKESGREETSNFSLAQDGLSMKFQKKWRQQTLKIDSRSKKYWESVRAIRFNPKSVIDSRYQWMKKIKYTPIPLHPEGNYLVEIVILAHPESKSTSLFNIQYDFIELQTKNTVYELVHSFYLKDR